VKITGLVLTVCIRRLSLALELGVALVAPAASHSLSRLTGDYVCATGCRLTDANPSIAVKGGEVDCVNEYGGLFQGKPIGAHLERRGYLEAARPGAEVKYDCSAHAALQNSKSASRKSFVE
jgi:hypothetical protein